MGTRLFDQEVYEALNTLREWQSVAAKSDRPDLLLILGTLQRDIQEQASQGSLDVSTLRKTLFFLSVLMKSRPQSQRRFAAMLHQRGPGEVPPLHRLELVPQD